MNGLPVYALSVRQPWAHAIIHLGKDIENRDWSKHHEVSLCFRGRVALHTGKGLGKAEYAEAAESIDFIMGEGKCPPAVDLRRGGIIGSVEVVDIVKRGPPREPERSPWFCGPYALILRDPQPCGFIPCIGQLGFWRWHPAGAHVVPEPQPWMLPKQGRNKPLRPEAPEPEDKQFKLGDL